MAIARRSAGHAPTICWDPAISPSSWHAVTSVVMGNCGVGIAPCKPEAREIAMRDLVNVEGIPFDVLNTGITWDWETFPEFLDAADRRGSSLNLGFLAPLTPFRHWVMGEASMERATTADERSQITQLMRQAVDAGAFGFSTTTLNQHIRYQARPLACRNAFRAELKGAAGFSDKNWGRLTVHEAHKPEMKKFEGRTVAEIAQKRGKDGVDTFRDLTLEDDLDIEFVLAQFNTDVTRVAENLRDPRVLIALSDGGAHSTCSCDAG